MRMNLMVICLFMFLCLAVSTTNALLVAHWELEGNANDSEGTNHGTIYGATPTTGIIGGALSFNGVDNYVALPNNEPIWLPQNDLTLACWVYFERDIGIAGEVLLDLNFAGSDNSANEVGCAIGRNQETGKLGFAMTTVTNSDEQLWSNTVLLKKKWYHIVVIRNSTEQSIYLNGQLDNSRTCTPDQIDFVGGYDDDTVNIGATHRKYYTSHSGHLEGIIDDVRIYDHALTEQQIADIIPEPTTLLLLGLGAVFLRRNR